MKTIASVILILAGIPPVALANDSISTADPLGLNVTLNGYAINPAGDNDYLRVVLSSAGDFSVYTLGSTDTYGYLLSSSGSTLASNDDSTGSLNFRIDRQLAAGTYYVRVRHYSANQTGAYSVRTIFTPRPVDDHGNTTSSATPVTLSGTATSSVSGNIHVAGDVDVFRLAVTGTGFLNVSSTGTTDTYGFLLNSAGTQIASNDDANGTTNFAIRHAVTAGTYYVKVRHYSSSGTGAYTLNARFEANVTPPSTGLRALVVGISNYQSINDLSLCDDDARDVSAALRASGWNVTTLIDAQASKSAIRTQITRLAPGGGRFLFYYSGHGSASGTTGYLCNYDCTASASTMISETELNSWLAAAGTTPVSVVLDSCFSGALINRNLASQAGLNDVTSRFFPAVGVAPADVRAGDFMARNISAGSRVVLTACRGSQLSVESSSWGHGWFTWRLLSVWRSGTADTSRNGWISIEETHAQVAGGYNYGGGRQDPQLYDGNGASHFDATRL